MRYKGNLLDFDDDLDESNVPIQEAVINDKKISLDWEEGDSQFHALLNSIDGGIVYSGTYGEPTPSDSYKMQAKRFVANNGEIILWATWENESRGTGGISVFRLKPEAPAKPEASAKPKTKTKPKTKKKPS